ncbi:pilus assembly protein TadG-related protein [Janibacter melonis]|uniref:pilus assembly protein TadG-related protein n=1 Tax=Janibacter melonis TaxID=262209 RepID=UPI00174C346D|nr:pilus assembly protein TadG-related protein [Janibacter melonis]
MSGLWQISARRAKGEDGQLSLLVLGLTVIALTLILGAMAVTSVQVTRMRLLDAADTAALDAADEDEASIYAEGIDQVVPVSDEAVQRTAAETLAGREMPPGLRSWQVAPGTGAADGQTAVVRLTGEADLPLVGGLIRGLGGSVTVTVESRAQARVPVAAP